MDEQNLLMLCKGGEGMSQSAQVMRTWIQQTHGSRGITGQLLYPEQ